MLSTDLGACDGATQVSGPRRVNVVGFSRRRHGGVHAAWQEEIIRRNVAVELCRRPERIHCRDQGWRGSTSASRRWPFFILVLLTKGQRRQCAQPIHRDEVAQIDVLAVWQAGVRSRFSSARPSSSPPPIQRKHSICRNVWPRIWSWSSSAVTAAHGGGSNASASASIAER